MNTTTTQYRNESNPNEPSIELFPHEISPLYWANLTAHEKIIINQGGTSSGKTHAIIRVLFTIAILRPKYIITVISNTITKLKEDALRIAKEVSTQPYIVPFIDNYNSSDRVFTFTNGSIMEFKSFEDEEQAKGGKRQILFINEATRIPYMIFYQADLRTEVRTFLDYNPTSEFWVHDKVIGNKVEFPSTKVIRSWHIHNPYLTQEQHDRIERIQDPELKKVYARGLTGQLKGTVYPNWNEVDIEQFPTDGIIWGIDWGFSKKESADPSAVVRIQFLPQGHDYDYIVDEIIYSKGIEVQSVAQIMKDVGYKSGQPVYCDHSNENIRELRLNHIYAYPAGKGPGSIIAGVLYLRNKRIAYTKRSANLKEELRRYKFMEIEGIITNTPCDEWNHLLDAARYAIHTHSLRTGKVA